MPAPLLAAAGRLLVNPGLKGNVARSVVGSALSMRQQNSAPAAPSAPRPPQPPREIGQNPAGYR